MWLVKKEVMENVQMESYRKEKLNINVSTREGAAFFQLPIKSKIK